ncbi:MAG: hypothetical protein ACRD3D_11550 [Terriglobia bacterium]
MWLHQCDQRFGTAGPDVLEPYQRSSQVINETVSSRMADLNGYLWPEINPGGLIDVPPSDPTTSTPYFVVPTGLAE